MTSTDSLNTLATVECPSSERLKHYLSGWLSDVDAEQVEQHLHACEHCESAMRQLDVHQETLLQSLQATMVQEPGLLAASTSLAKNGSPDSSPADPSKGGSAVIDEALSKARRLLDTPLEAENDPKPVAWHPTHRDFGCYELLRPLGRGGMGAVYLARHRQLGKQVAIKLLPVMSAEDSDVRTRFDREIRVVGRLNHPSIVAATDAGEIEGTQFLVMEYVPGLDLSRLARLMGRLPVAEACELIRQASLGLSCAHAEGVVHRDIKPSNLMLDDLGRIRILDFGLAQWTVWDEASVDLTTVGQLMGTLDYMAPEQAEAIGAVDYRADLYALGATLFRLLCGRAPLAAAPNQSPLEKLRLLSNHQPPKLSTLCPEAPEELVKLVASLLSRSPSDRPASAAHVAEQLAPFAEGAKLVELLQQAKEKAAASPELLKRTALYEPPFPGSAVPMSPPEPAASSGGRFKTLRRHLLAASLPLLIVAGILIKLELNKGQLIIESDVDNVNVKVLKDGKPVDGIQVNHGTTSTRLYADNYEITIDGPSDGLIIDHDKFTLKNGETVVARISRDSALPHSGATKSGSVPDEDVDLLEVVLSLENHSKNLNSTIVNWLKSSRLPNSDNVLVDMAAFQESVRRLRSLKGDELTSPKRRLELEALYRSWRTLYQHLSQCQMAEERQKLSESAREINSALIALDAATPKDRSFVPLETTPLYNGQPLSYWVAALRTDRSPAKQRECLEAIRRLATVADSAEATTGLTEFLRAELAEEQDVVDELGFVCIALLNPDQRFLSWWMQEFQTGNESWKARLSGLGAPLTFRSGDQLAEFEHWVKALTAQKKLSREDVNQVADFIAKLGSTSECSREVSDRLVQLLDDATKDDRSWWLSMPHQVRFDKLSDRYEFLQLFSLRSCRIACDVIGNPESTSTQIAQAAMVFHSHLDHRPHESSSAQNPDHFRELHAEPNRTCFLNAAEGYLKRIKSQPARMTEFIKVPQEFEKEAKYQHFSTTSRCGIKLSHEVMPNGTGTNPAPDCRANPLIEVLDAIYLYTYTAPQDPALNLPQSRSFYVPAELTDTVKALRSELQALVPQANLNGPHVDIVLSWPELLPAGPFWSESPVAGTGEIWGQYTPTSDDWLRLCVLNHQVLNAPFVGEHDPGLTTTVTDPSTPAAQTNSRLAMENEPVTPSPLYNGQPLEYWLTVIENERSIERLRSAFGACSVLLTEDTAGLITEKVLAALPEVSPTKLKLSATSDEIRQLDLLAFRLVSLANPGEKWITVMVRELDKHDDSWQSRVVSHLWLNSEADRLSDKNLLPLVEWVRIKLAAETATDAVGRVRAAEGLLRIIQREEAPVDLSSKCVSILDAETTLPLSWWFAKPLRYPEGQSTVGLEECWPNPLHHTVVTRAVNALNDGKLQGQELGHALVILKQAETLSPEQKVVLLNCVKRQLVERSASADRLTEFAPVSPSFTRLCLPKVGLSFHVSLPRPPGLCLISFELLNLLQQLDPLPEDADTIQSVRNALPKVEPIFQTQSSSFFSSRRVQPPSIAWPELKMNGKAIDRIQLATYLISQHTLLKVKATSGQSTDLDVADENSLQQFPDEVRVKSADGPVLHRGKSLQLWITELDQTTFEESVLQAILITQPILDSKDPVQISAFQSWFARYVTEPKDAPSKRAELVPLVATYVLSLKSDAAFQDPLIEALEASPYISPEWWFVPLTNNPDQSPIDSKRLKLAIEKLEDTSCSEEQLAASANIISGLHAKETLDDAEKVRIGQLLIRRIQILLAQPDATMWRSLDLGPKFGESTSTSEVKQSRASLKFYKTTLVEELLTALLAIGQTGNAEAELREIAERALAVRKKMKLQGDSLTLWLLTTSVHRERFSAAPTGPGVFDAEGATSQRTPEVCSDELWGIGSNPSEADWLRFCVSYHKALAPYRKKFEGAEERAKSTALASSGALYNGQPLEHWLDMIGRERSVEGLKVAFEACDALVSKENSPIITETLLKFLPVLDGELKLLDKEANRYWTLDYEAARLLWKANPGAQFFTLWVKERSESKDEKWNQRLDQYATLGSIESSGDVQPFVEWARSVLTPSKSGSKGENEQADPGAVQSSAGLLRGMLNNETLRADETFVSTATAILTESPYLSDVWWLSQPLLYRGPQGDRELFPAAYQRNVVRNAIVALQTQTDPALVAQACMILANGVKLDREETDKVLQAVQKRIEQTVKTPEFFAMVHVPASFSSFAVTTVDTKDALKIETIQLSVRSSMVQFIPVTDTSLAIQLLNVIASLNGRTTCEPQCRMVLEATRGVFDRVRVNYGKRTERAAVPTDRFRGATNRLPIQLLWPELTRTDSDQGQGRISEVIDSRVKDIWGDHAPTQSDWLQLLILNHSAMEDVVAAELEKSVEQK